MSINVVMWSLFGVFVVGALAVDLGLKSHRHRHEPVSLKEATRWTMVWVFLALVFGVVIYFFLGRQLAFEFLTAYLVEESLSVDNMFVFILIFNFFAIPGRDQPRVLKWGILGAIIMRFVLIFTGVALLQRFEWLLYVFGALLILTALKMLFQKEDGMKPDQNPLLRIFNRFMPVTKELYGEHFFVKQGARWAATPLFATLLVVEASDLMFAMDSIPAVLAISRHPFIVFTSNVFAILGLRALFFLVSGVMQLFRYLRYGLAAILVFIGAKMLLKHVYEIPVLTSLAVVAFCLAVAVLSSVLIKEEAPSR